MRSSLTLPLPLLRWWPKGEEDTCEGAIGEAMEGGKATGRQALKSATAGALQAKDSPPPPPVCGVQEKPRQGTKDGRRREKTRADDMQYVLLRC